MASVHRRVAVTGLGALTPLGADAPSTWSAMLAGRCGVGRLRQGWAAPLPVRIAAQVAAGAPAGGPASPGRLDRATWFLLSALREAWSDAGFAAPDGGQAARARSGSPPHDRIGVSIGTGAGGAVAMLDRRLGRAPGMPTLMISGPAVRAGRLVGAGAGVHTVGSACAAGADAIAYGLAMIRAGRADVVAAGGTEAPIHPLTIAAFARMSALSRRNDEPHRACRPYDKNRDGFVLGEGAAVLILESAEHAKARGAQAYCELAGAGFAADAHHITAPDPSGRGMRQAVRAALADACLSQREVAHVNAHATASSAGDLAESYALAAALSKGDFCVSATKSMTGHLIGAAGAVEALATVLAVRDRMAPPTINLDDPDDAVDLDVVRRAPRPLPAGAISALSGSAGFGGQNVVLAFRTAEG